MANKKITVLFVLIALAWGGQSPAQKKAKGKSITPTTERSAEAIERSMAEASLAELGGSVDIEELNVDRDKYIGQVVKLRYYCPHYMTSSSGSSSRVYVHDDAYLKIYLSLPDDPEARKWAMEADKRDSSGSVYIYVEKNSILAIGTKRSKGKEGTIYSW